MSSINEIGRKGKNYLKDLKRKTINKKKPGFYYKTKDLLMRIGLRLSPNCFLIHRKYAIYAMNKKEWKSAVYHWGFVFESNKGKPLPEDYLSLTAALRKEGEIIEVESVLKEGLKRLPNNIKIKMELVDLYKKQKKWKKAAELLCTLVENRDKNLDVNIYMDLTDIYLKLHLYDKAEHIIHIALRENPRNKKAMYRYAQIAVQAKDWKLAIERMESLVSLYQHKDNPPLNHILKISMAKQLTGDFEQASNTFNSALVDYKHDIEKDTKGYRKIVLYDNGESRIEFYKNLCKTDKIVMTFDSINMVWGNPPFAFKLLLRHGVDILALRKRKKKTYHQDLSKEEYVRVTNVLLSGYKEKIAYGFSLGAYAALYYSSDFNPRILALSPRLSIHPVYGKEKEIAKHDFEHDLSNNYNAKISPIIVYDPKNKLDSNYVQNGLIRVFPNAKLIKVPYGGHGTAPHLSKVGLLKGFVVNTINKNEIPEYNRRLRSKSGKYYRILGLECLRHNKLRWADDLSKRSIELTPDDKRGIKLRVDVLIALNQYDNAIHFAEKAVQDVPNNIDIKVVLIDLYIQTENLVLAENELGTAIKKFGRKTKLIKRKEKIEETQKKELLISV